MPRTQFTALTAIVLFFGVPGAATAQDVKWYTDYSAARKEATETGRALVLDFGTDACFWCKKLDATTFRDPKVMKLLNERFVAVKIDAQKHPRLAEALKVESYPTLVLATADGKVLGRHVGYLDAVQFTGMLNKAPAPTAAPAPVAVAVPLTDAEKQRRAKEEIDAALAALLPEIAAGLER